MAHRRRHSQSLSTGRTAVIAGNAVQDLSKILVVKIAMDNKAEIRRTFHGSWKKVAYGGMQLGYDDNYTDESFLNDLVMNANVVKRDFTKVMLDSVAISQYLCIVALVLMVWICILSSLIKEFCLLSLDAVLLGLGFASLLLTSGEIPLQLLSKYILKVSLFVIGLYVLSPIYETLTRSISSDSIWALTISLIIFHLFLHDYSGYTVRPPGVLANPTLASNISLNASIVASVLMASLLPSQLLVFAALLFSLLVFLFSPLVSFCIKKYSFKLHLWLSVLLILMTLGTTFCFHKTFFTLLLCLLVFISIVCPYWLIRMQEYKFEIHGPWDEAKLCFEIND